jgi:hypothetical protein
MGISYALVLACDLLPDASDVGPKTIIRLKRALTHWKETGEYLVVAASFSTASLHVNQSTAMANMMADWLKERGCTEVVVLRALMFNTRGETDAFFELEHSLTIVSASWHLRRVKIQLLSDYGFTFVRSLSFVSVDQHQMSRKEKFILEPLKLGFEVFTFKWRRSARNWLWNKIVRLLKRFGISLSY